jgi:small GTP-binding protein
MAMLAKSCVVQRYGYIHSFIFNQHCRYLWTRKIPISSSDQRAGPNVSSRQERTNNAPPREISNRGSILCALLDCRRVAGVESVIMAFHVRLAAARQHSLCAAVNRCLSTATTSSSSSGAVSGSLNLVSILDDLDLLPQIPLQDVRNFCFIAHIDHGKSSLSSRILELTGNLGSSEQVVAYNLALQNDQQNQTLGSSSAEFSVASTHADAVANNNADSASPHVGSKERINLLDTLAVEQQRGITVKASTASMLYRHSAAVGPTGTLLLNMFDTPGHVDFGREVSRSLSFVQGAVLLLDASQGIQAQTWSVYEKVKALPSPPKLLIALTKVDLPSARPVHVALTVSEWLQFDDPDAIMYTSARNRIGVKQVLDAVCEHVEPPTALADDAGSAEAGVLRAQVVDSWYDTRGVNCLVQIVAGKLKEGDRISLVGGSVQQQQQSFPVQEVGIVLPRTHRTGQLLRGQLGYVRFGLRDPRQAMPGTVLIWTSHVGKKDLLIPAQCIDTSTKSVLYASVHPADADSFEELSNAVDRLALNDTGLEVSKTSSIGSGMGGPFLGPGLRVGFQGLLHVEVFRQRLQDEFNIDAVVTPPKVPYSITWMAGKKNPNGEEVTKLVEDLADWVCTERL